MTSIKQKFKSLLNNYNVESKEIINFVTDNVPTKKRNACYDHLYYCFLFSGLKSPQDLMIAAKDFAR